MVALAKLRPVDSGQHDKDELRDIVESRPFRFGRYTLSSGIESDIYFNMKPTMMWPRGAELAAREFIKIVNHTRADYVGGLEMGAVPVIGSIAAVSAILGNPIPTIFVRKKAKAHGTKDVVEGLGPNESLAGKKILVVDDVATSGKSILQAIEEIRLVGGDVTDAAALVDRNEGGAQLLREHGVTLHSVLHVRDFVDGR